MERECMQRRKLRDYSKNRCKSNSKYEEQCRVRNEDMELRRDEEDRPKGDTSRDTSRATSERVDKHVTGGAPTIFTTNGRMDRQRRNEVHGVIGFGGVRGLESQSNK